MADEITSMMASLGMEDMNIPELKLVQATGGDYAKEIGAVPGKFFVSTTNEIYDNITVQVMIVTKQRTFWGRTEINDEPPICSSNDGLTSIEGQSCKGDNAHPACQHYRERASMDKEERRKECQLGYVVLALDTNGMPLIVRLMGISADTARDLNFLLTSNKAIRGNRGGFYFQITSVKKKTSSGEAFMFKFNLAKDNFPGPEAQAEYRRIAVEMKLLAPAPGTTAPKIAGPDQNQKALNPGDEKQTITPGEVGEAEQLIGDLTKI